MNIAPGSRLPVAFHAPLKAPGHPVPSGDRRMARLMLRALEAAGFAPEVASDLRTFDRSGSSDLQETIEARAAQEAERLLAVWKDCDRALRPHVWFTYHCHYKAPDLIGPAVSAALGIPYVVAEGSRTSKHRSGPWARWSDASDRALDAAQLLFAMTDHDRVALERHLLPGQRLADLPPFLDLADWPLAPRKRPGGTVRLLAVAMMRADVKRDSYLLLARALDHIAIDWSLDIAGDGEARAEIEAAFHRFGERVVFHGLVEDRTGLHGLHAKSDLLVWPAIGEAYGVAPMEAQAAGLPVIAGKGRGVASILRHDETGLLVDPIDPLRFARAIETGADRAARGLFGIDAFHAYRIRHGLEAAADVLRRELAALLEAA